MADHPSPVTPSRLELLRFARRLYARNLAQTDHWISEEEQRERERARGEAARPPSPDWLVERDLAGTPSRVHAGHCATLGPRSRGIDRTGALQALANGVLPCPQCRPDTLLGALD